MPLAVVPQMEAEPGALEPPRASAALFLLMAIGTSVFVATFLTIYCAWSSTWRALTEGINDRYDLDTDWAMLLLAVLLVALLVALAALVWNAAAWWRRPRASTGRACMDVCCGADGLVALAWWLLVAACVCVATGFVIGFQLVYPAIYGFFARFAVLSLPVAQPVLLVILTALFPLALLAGLRLVRWGRSASSQWSAAAWYGAAALLGTLWLGFFVWLWVAPLLLVDTNTNIRATPLTVQAPQLVAHRLGASLAPENTMAALNRTLALVQRYPGRIAVLETDVQFSRDGVPLLLHDSTFRRTTNIATLFPSRALRTASSLTWAFIQQLDAGSYVAVVSVRVVS